MLHKVPVLNQRVSSARSLMLARDSPVAVHNGEVNFGNLVGAFIPGLLTASRDFLPVPDIRVDAFASSRRSQSATTAPSTDPASTEPPRRRAGRRPSRERAPDRVLLLLNELESLQD